MARLLELVLSLLLFVSLAQARRCVRQNVAPRPCSGLHTLNNVTVTQLQGKWLFMEQMLLEGYQKVYASRSNKKKSRASRLQGRPCLPSNKRGSQCRLLDVKDGLGTVGSHIEMSAKVLNVARNGSAAGQPDIKQFRLGVAEPGRWRLEPGVYPRKSNIDLDVLLVACDPSQYAVVVICSTVRPETWADLSEAEVAALPLYLQPQHPFHAAAVVTLARPPEQQPRPALRVEQMQPIRDKIKAILGLTSYHPDKIGAYC